MRIIINDKEVNFPSSLSEITLGQRIDFFNQYGRDLEAMHKSILEIEDSTEQEIEFAQFSIEKMFSTFAFFAGVTVDALKESQFIDDIAGIYFSCLVNLFEQEEDLEFKSSHVWNSEVWEIHPPVLKQGSHMTFGEFVDAKQVLQDMAELGKGEIDKLLRLCAIYLRKQGEAYDESFLYEDSERLQLMRSLPMDIAMQVGFFLSSSANTYLNILPSSSLQGLKAVEDIQPGTLNNGDGSISSNQSLKQRFSILPALAAILLSAHEWPGLLMC